MASKVATSGFRQVLKRWAWTKSGFNQYGLKVHDLLHETPQVKEAIRRLPQNLQDERQFRMIRAVHLSATKSVLPREQWTKFEDEDWYLHDYLEEVQNEEAEKAAWAKK